MNQILTRAQALLTYTSNLNVEQIANIISVEGEPEKNISDLRNIKSIIHRGRVHKLFD